MNVDPTGESFIVSLIGATLIGAVIGGAIGAVSAALKGENFWGGFLSGALVGGVLGAATLLGGATALAISGKAVEGFIVASTFAVKGMLLATSVGITALTSFGAGVGSYAIEKSFNNQQFDWGEALMRGVNTTIKGMSAFMAGIALASGGAYNYLLKGAAKRAVSQMLIDGITNGIVANTVKIVNMPWYFIF